jgi:hypothetical protein
MRKTIELNCEVCGVPFMRALSEHKRNTRLGRKQLCTRTCQGNLVAGNLGKFKGMPRFEHLDAGNRRDDFTGFRYYKRKAAVRHPTSNVELADIKAQWELQGGKCIYTGIPLVLKDDKHGNKSKKPYQIASLDRIDSSKPYDRGNIQFVSASINFLKNDMTDADTKELIAIIRQTI